MLPVPLTCFPVGLQKEKNGRKYIEFEFASKAPTYIRHAYAVVTVGNGALNSHQLHLTYPCHAWIGDFHAKIGKLGQKLLTKVVEIHSLSLDSKPVTLFLLGVSIKVHKTK